jgi:hypothetical protein
VWKNKKVILVALLAGLALLGSTVGVVLAQTGDGDTSQPQADNTLDTLLDRVAQIYQEKTGVAIDPQQLKDAFAQAQKEMQDKAVEDWLQKLVDEGKITAEQKDEYLQWWQARPETPLPGPFGRGFRGGMRWGWGGPYSIPEASGSGL